MTITTDNNGDHSPIASADPVAVKRMRYHITGTVQGVGFRPFIYRMASQHGLSGFVQNTPEGVIVELEGRTGTIIQCLNGIKSDLPPLASIYGISGSAVPAEGGSLFHIIPSSTSGSRDVQITPDAAICSECLNELFDPSDKRHLYPFINCTNCGPRLTIINDVPYDRGNTSMSCFPLCPDCRAEYDNPADRRFHAEPNACPVCGPALKLLDSEGNEICRSEALARAVELIMEGKVIAVKGIGGFHLAADATDSKAVQRLRDRKFREEKPLAIMLKNMDLVEAVSIMGERERALLYSPERPIVLLKKKENTLLSPLVAPGMSNLGVMLPYAPLHYLLFNHETADGKSLCALLMTSANQTDEPICIGNREAVARLKGIADYYLVHNRDILVRCDDSIAMAAAGKERMLRRARGYTPRPLFLSSYLPDTLALGGHLKATVCIVKDNQAFLSPHIGDLDTPQARDFFRESILLMEKITERKPEIIACDLHPGYFSTRFAAEMDDIRIIPVQHHHAHVVSCMAENRLTGKVIGLSMDGTGYGTDGQVWGGEFLVADETSFSRTGHIGYYRLPGAEKAVREPWRIAAGLLCAAYGDAWSDIAESVHLIPCDDDKKDFHRTAGLLGRMMTDGLNSPWTSSLGRLFDGVAAIAGLRNKVSFEGQAAMELEAIAGREGKNVLPYEIKILDDKLILDFSGTIRSIVEMRQHNASKERIAAAFHATLPRAFTAMAERIRADSALNRVALSGGCFQNRRLLEDCINELTAKGFDVFTHQITPANDGGLSLGQAVCAANKAIMTEV